MKYRSREIHVWTFSIAWNFAGFSTTTLPWCLPHVRAIRSFEQPILRLRDTKSYAETSVRLVNRYHGFCRPTFNSHLHDDVIKRKNFPRYWPFVWGIHRSPVNSPHKGQWRGALMFTLICDRINGWVNNGEAGDLRRNRAHYDVIVMCISDRTLHEIYDTAVKPRCEYIYYSKGCKLHPYNYPIVRAMSWFCNVQ